MSQVKWQLLSDSEKLDENLTDYCPDPYEHIRSKSERRWTLALVALLAVSLGLNAVFYINQRERNFDQLCTEHATLNWSPVIAEQPMTYSTIRFNGSLFAEGIYRQAPSPEVDEKWSELGLNYRPQIITKEKAVEAGLSLKQAKRAKADGGGFFVEVEAIHHMHCLNVLRQNVWFNYEYYRDRKIGVWANTLPIVHLHVGHCIDILRQQLMCSADISLFGQVWVEFNKGNPRTFADFSTHHKCRNYDLVKKWAEENQSNESDRAEYQEGDITLDKYP